MVTPWLTAYPLNSFLNSDVTLKLRVSVPTAVHGDFSLPLRGVVAFASSMMQAAPLSRAIRGGYVLDP